MHLRAASAQACGTPHWPMRPGQYCGSAGCRRGETGCWAQKRWGPCRWGIPQWWVLGCQCSWRRCITTEKFGMAKKKSRYLRLMVCAWSCNDRFVYQAHKVSSNDASSAQGWGLQPCSCLSKRTEINRRLPLISGTRFRCGSMRRRSS